MLSVVKILRSDHSNKTSLPVFSHGVISLSKFCKMKYLRIIVEFCLWPHLSPEGLKSDLF